jgi:hypothetical protein
MGQRKMVMGITMSNLLMIKICGIVGLGVRNCGS